MMNRNGQHIFIVDDESKVLEVIGETLEQVGLNVSCFASATDCLEQLGSRKCDLLITDLRMPEMDGIQLLRLARLVTPFVPVLIVTGYGDIPTAIEAVKAGADDFIEKPLDKKGFVDKVKSMLGENGSRTDMPCVKSLTLSESRVLKLVIDGKTNKEIANLLNRSKRTVEVHRARVMRKLGVDNVIDLVKRSAAMGL